MSRRTIAIVSVALVVVLLLGIGVLALAKNPPAKKK